MTSALDAFQLGLIPVLTATLSLGPQNTFVLRHGLAADQVSLAAGVCLGCDVAIIIAATLGFGAVIGANPLTTSLLTWAGACYLLLGAYRMLCSARDRSAAPTFGHLGCSKLATLLQAFGISVLNPLLWVETVLVLSALASTVSFPALPYFALGAAIGSLTKLSLLGFASRGLASLFVRRSFRRGFDAVAGAAMLAMTFILAWPSLHAVAGRPSQAQPELRIAMKCTHGQPDCPQITAWLPSENP